MLLTLVLISFNGSLAVQVTASPNEVRDILGSALIHFRRTLPAGPTALDPTPPPAPLMLEDNDSLSPRGRAWDGPRASINGDLAQAAGAQLKAADQVVMCGDERTPCGDNGATVHLRISNPRLDGDVASVLITARWFEPRTRRSEHPASYTTAADVVVRLEKKGDTWHVARTYLMRIT